MRDLRALAGLALAGVVALVVLGFFAASLAFALALVLPMVGVAWLALRVRVAVALWRSRGRFQLGPVVRIIEPNRARALALAELGRGAGGLALGVSPTLAVFVGNMAALAAAAAGLLLLAVTGRVRRLLEAGARPIDVLPKE